MSERSAEPGELCTCGRPAVTVLTSATFGEVGYCGRPGEPKLDPCPFCGEGPHDSERCPEYRLRPEVRR